jgi:hypothetical protein
VNKHRVSGLVLKKNKWHYEGTTGIVAAVGSVRFCRIGPRIVPVDQNLYKLEKQSGPVFYSLTERVRSRFTEMLLHSIILTPPDS